MQRFYRQVKKTVSTQEGLKSTCSLTFDLNISSNAFNESFPRTLSLSRYPVMIIGSKQNLAAGVHSSRMIEMLFPFIFEIIG
jgi:hypothetical protein